MMGPAHTVASTPLWMYEPEVSAHGTVLLLHHRSGLDEFTTDVAARLVGHGFVVALPDLFAGLPPDIEPEQRKRQLRDDEVLGVLAEAVRLAAAPGRPVSALGFCMGGRLAFLSGVAGIGVTRACCFYGGEIDVGWHAPTSPLERVGHDAAAVQLHRGARDSNATAAQCEAAIAAFDRSGAYLEACTYAGARHAFANVYAGERYHAAAAARAWQSALAFIEGGSA